MDKSRADHFRIIACFTVLALATACAPAVKPVLVDSTTPSSPEASACDTTRTYSGGKTITGTAYYKRRTISTSGLGAVDATNYPIRYAEVRVVKGSSEIQCGTTQSDGTFSLVLPTDTAIYTIYVNSRANNSYVKASILNNPTSNSYYSLSTTVVPDADKSVGTLTAQATGDVLGGAFNIFDQVVRANDFLRLKTLNCDQVATANYVAGCTPFTVAPKATIYWTLGFNPGTYVGTSSGLSFYVPSDNYLYILGGISGNISSQDTDHFDNAVILHEYGHFLENQFSKSDSPGGSHSGGLIDPRLAWSEGFADFFGVMVNYYYTGSTYYIDTSGNPDGTASAFGYNIEDTTVDAVAAYNNGAGNFLEFSIYRGLWDMVDTANDDSTGAISGNSETGAPFNDTDAIKFVELWKIFDIDLAVSTNRFRNYGLFMELHQASLTSVATTLTREKQKANRTDYAYYVTAQASGSCAATSITGPGSATSLTSANIFNYIDYFHYYHSGGALQVYLERTAGTGDIDLYVFPDGYTFKTSQISTGSNTGSPHESVNTSLSAGHYMIMVHAYQGSASYKLWKGTNTAGDQLCP